MPKSFYKNLVLEIPAGVYEPCEDSFLLAEILENENLAGKKFLDVGCGCGIQAIIAAKSGCDVTAVDIDENALKTAEANAKAAGVKIKFFVSDLFKNVREKFDIIVFNAPYLPEKISAHNMSWAAGEKNEIIFKFITEAKNFLEPNGKIFLVISSLTGLDEILKRFNFECLVPEIINEKKVPFETLYVIGAKSKTYKPAP